MGNPGLMTVREIADAHGLDVRRTGDIITDLAVRPAMVAGLTRLFTPDDAAAIVAEARRREEARAAGRKLAVRLKPLAAAQAEAAAAR